MIIERDGRYPPMSVLLAQVARAREMLAAGRRSRTTSDGTVAIQCEVPPAPGIYGLRSLATCGMSDTRTATIPRPAWDSRRASEHAGKCAVISPALESLLARLYTDGAFLELLMLDPRRAMSGAGLSEQEESTVVHMDRASLLLAVHSFERKRASRRGRPGSRWRGAVADCLVLRFTLRGWVRGKPRWRHI